MFVAGHSLHLFPSGDEYPDYDDVAVSTEGVNYLLFEVEACTKAKILFGWIPFISLFATYEIVLGTDGNKGLVVKSVTAAGDVVAAAEDTTLLNCSSMTQFYLRWSDTFIKVIYRLYSFTWTFVSRQLYTHEIELLANVCFSITILVLFQVGQGVDIRRNQLVHYEPSGSFYVNYVSFATTDGVEGHFHFTSSGEYKGDLRH